MTEADVEKMLANPVYAGVGPYPRIVSDDDWIKANERNIKEWGARKFLVVMLETLRESLGTVDSRDG